MLETEQKAGSAEVLTGRIAEYQELLDVLEQRPGLTVIVGDPWSGTSALLAAAIDELHGTRVLVDARSCSDGRDLAMMIADTAIAQLAPDAAAWWAQAAPPASAAGLRLSHTLHQSGIDFEDLRLNTGADKCHLPDAIELLLALADGDALLAIDHLGLMLSSLPDHETRRAPWRPPRLTPASSASGPCPGRTSRRSQQQGPGGPWASPLSRRSACTHKASKALALR